MPRQLTSLTLADARSLIAAGEQKAQELGASGGTVDQDLKVAEAAVAAFQH